MCDSPSVVKSAITTAYNKSRKRPVEDPEEVEAPIIQDRTMNDATQDEDQEIEEPQELVDPP